MDIRQFDLKIVSANDLVDVRNFGRMKVYAKVSINDMPNSEKQTPVDNEHGTNPWWNHTISYKIGEGVVQSEGNIVSIKLYSERTIGDKYVGEVNLDLKKLFNYSQSKEQLYFNIRSHGSETSRGTVYIGYSFGEKITVERTLKSKTLETVKIGAKILLKGVDIVFLGGSDLTSLAVDCAFDFIVDVITDSNVDYIVDTTYSS